jgi:sugar phosphate isomerase/epimerase
MSTIRGPKSLSRIFLACRRPSPPRRDAAKHGTAIVLEVMPFGNVRRLKLAAPLSRERTIQWGLLLDIWHMGRGGIDYNEVATIPHRFISSIELDDADEKVVGSLWEDTIHHRRLPGEGVLHPRTFIRSVQTAGYRGPWGVEILSESFRKLPLTEMAQKSFEATMEQFPQ